MRDRNLRAAGFDLARRSGYVVVEDAHPHPIVVESGVFWVPEGLTLPDELEWLRKEVICILAGAGHLDGIGYEEVPVKHGRGAHTLEGQHRQYGVFLAALSYLQFRGEIIGVAPQRWQGDMLGITRDRLKLKAEAMRQARLRLEYVTRDSEIADSAMIAAWTLGTMRLSGRGMLAEVRS